MNVLATAFLYFLGQIFIYRVTIKMSQNVNMQRNKKVQQHLLYRF
jgi:hypothetical protein